MTPKLHQLIALACRMTGADPSLILVPCRTQREVLARKFCMVFLHQTVGLSQSESARVIGVTHHSTVAYAVASIAGIEADPRFRNQWRGFLDLARAAGPWVPGDFTAAPTPAPTPLAPPLPVLPMRDVVAVLPAQPMPGCDVVLFLNPRLFFKTWGPMR